jgi:hypothetical protein
MLMKFQAPYVYDSSRDTPVDSICSPLHEPRPVQIRLSNHGCRLLNDPMG